MARVGEMAARLSPRRSLSSPVGGRGDPPAARPREQVLSGSLPEARRGGAVAGGPFPTGGRGGRPGPLPAGAACRERRLRGDTQFTLFWGIGMAFSSVCLKKFLMEQHNSAAFTGKKGTCSMSDCVVKNGGSVQFLCRLTCAFTFWFRKPVCTHCLRAVRLCR